MLKRLKTFLTARTTVLVLIALELAAMVAAVVIDQVTPPASAVAAGAAQGAASVTELLGLDHVFSTWWFAALSVVFLVSLLLSTFDQLRIALARMLHLPSAQPATGERCALERTTVEQVLSREGYWRVAEDAGTARFVKFWPGHWGSFLLHLGMTITILFALVYVLTEHRATVRVVSGHSAPTDAGTLAVRRGLLAGQLALPASVTLLNLEPTFREDDRLGDLAADLALVDRHGASHALRVAVNAPPSFRGITVYQQLTFGNAFFVQLDHPVRGRSEVTLPLPMPARRDVAGYGEFPLWDERLHVKAKYFANADRAGIIPEDPILFLRLHDGERMLSEVSLRTGDRGQLGPYAVRLAAVGWWTDVLFDGSLGTFGIFAGFAVLLCGGALTFFAVPREVVLRDDAGGCTMSWRTARFHELYREERDRIRQRCGVSP